MAIVHLQRAFCVPPNNGLLFQIHFTPAMSRQANWVPSAIPDTVETFELPTVIATLPIHIFTLLFITVVMVSLLTTRHLHSRPRRLFAINCAFFLIASLYDLAFDISYLVIINRQITVQACSVIRNFVYNPIATQAFVDAFERFLMAFFNYDMPLVAVFALYSLFPLISVVLAFYNSFFTDSLLRTDDVCATVRRTKWTNIVLVVIQWASAVIAVILYVAVWRKVFLVCCMLPVVLSVPSLIISILTEFDIYQNSVANVAGIVILDMTTPITWIIYISYISHIRRSLFDCILCRMRRRPATQKIHMEAL
ncbi:unnamed protein product [Heligmosomoides polygyrus]|uniref:G_PROTEIN_RECEP_F1_2 domain-containing protein n=1 Tax=Heligmosomoides polygyrus TaxID=6339 RepID=A0A183FNV5_HELPZ|nr:unnamed protein product [Heligmosomoides polygyrus]